MSQSPLTLTDESDVMFNCKNGDRMVFSVPFLSTKPTITLEHEDGTVTKVGVLQNIEVAQALINLLQGMANS